MGMSSQSLFVSYLFTRDGVGHVSWVDHGWNAAEVGHGSVNQSEVVLLIL